MGVLFTNNASTTLSAAISSTSATSISVASSSTFPAPGAGEYFYATIDDTSNIEIVKVTAVSGTTWTVVRGADNTTAATFANGTTVQLRAAAALLTDIQQNIAAKSANQTVYNATTASSATSYDVGTNPQNENNAMVFLDGVMQHHDTFSFSGSTLTFDAAPSNGLKLEVIIDNLINLQSSNLTVDTFTATNGQTAFTLSDTPAAEDNLIVFIEGVFQNQDSYSISNNVLTMSAGVTTGRKVVVYVINPVNIGTPSDGTVTSAKLSGNITMPGTLTVGSNDVAFDSPTFVVDNANSRVGLGTASPSVPVDIVGDVKMSSTLELTSHLDMPDDAYLKIGTGDDLQIYHNASDSIIRDVGTGRLLLGASELLVTNSGLSEAQIQSLEDGAVTLYHNGNAKLATASGGVSVTGATTTDTLTVSTSLNGRLASFNNTHASGTGLAVQTASNGTEDVLRVRGNGGSNQVLFCSGAGNVGIGTESPGFHVDIQKSLSETYSASARPTALARVMNTNTANNNHATLEFGTEPTSGNGGVAYIGSTVTGSNLADLFFGTRTGASTFATHMTLKSDGKIGIGTTSPGSTLTVQGAIESTKDENNSSGEGGQLILRAASASSTNSQRFSIDNFNNSGNSLFRIFKENDSDSSSGAVRFAIDHNGNVGIGTTSPGTILNLRSDTSDDGILLEKSDGTDIARLFHDGTSTNARFDMFSGGTAKVQIRTSGDTHFSGGNVGIGTASPSQLLHISSTGSAGILLEADSDNVNEDHVGEIQITQDGGSTYHKLGTNNNNHGYINVSEALVIERQGTEKMRMDTSGNLHVGATSDGFPSTVGISIMGSEDAIKVSRSSGAPVFINRGTNDGAIVNIYARNNLVGSIVVDSSNTTYNTSSDARLKDVSGEARGLEVINALNPVAFNWKADNAEDEGLLAQEVMEIVPNAVSQGEDEYYQMDYSKLVTPLIKAVQEQQEQIEELKARIKTLEDA